MSEQARATEQGLAHLSECYFLPINALLMVMSQVDSVSLYAQVTTLPAMVTGPYRIALTLHQGTVACCNVARVNGGIVLDGERALHALQGIGDIWWNLAHPGRPEHAAVNTHWSNLMPRRVPAPVALQQLPQRVRHVLSLADGNRNLPQIAQLLHLSLEDVFQILRHACAAGWIDALPLKEV